MSEMNPHEQKEVNPAPTGNGKYWLSLEQWGNDPEFQKLAETEFQSSPLREGEQREDGWARREFLKLMGASLALASAGCLRRPVQKIVPYNKQPEEVTFETWMHYTSTFSDGADGLPLMMRTREGRPVKIEGNPEHPLTLGGTTARAQASILSLYDPERLQGPKKNLLNKTKTNRDTINAKWEEVDDAIVKQLGKGGVVVLTGHLTSPATRAVVSDFAQAFGASHVSWEPLAHEEIRDGQKAAYGEDVVPFYRFDKAKVIVSIDADFLGTWLQPAVFNRQFSNGRRKFENMNKLVVFDSHYSLTGANADLRVRIKPSQQLSVVMGLLHEIIVKNGQSRYAADSRVKAMLEPFAQASATLAMEPAVFSRIAQDLWKNRGSSLVVAGGLPTLTEAAKSLQIAVNFLNSVLENDGATVDHRNALPGVRASYKELADLTERLNKGQVKTVIIHKTNPLYALPAGHGFREAIKKAEMVIYTGDRIDETGLVADYVLPDNHPYESWGDLEMTRGLLSVHQPTIRPMYDTRSFQLSLMTWAFMAKRGPKRLTTYETYYDYLRAFWREDIHPKYGRGQSFDAFWDEMLQKGFVDGTATTGGARTFRTEALSSIKNVKAEGYELVLYPTVALGDGSMANVAWLQELPDPVTKICWDNYACISIATAEKWGVKEGHILELTVGTGKIKIPAHIQPGLHDEVVALPVGYGRTGAGKVGNNIGVNTYQLAHVKEGEVVYSGLAVTAKNTKEKYDLANQQAHHAMGGRKIVVEATLAEYLKDAGANNHKHKLWNIWAPHAYNGHKWGMVVDLNTCTGCNACTVACQSENNVPVVGKKYVLQGREMYWLRVDRYFVGEPANAETVFQPVMCQHCDTAPCETVCPVMATVHSHEGLNDMIYNRCVGTRYCANNCPYKVRRFNWFHLTKNIEQPLHLALNPDVTVRPRGVMEKCTFCVQRITEGKNKAKLAGVPVKDGDIKTACQSACPTSTIVFGDLNDPESQVAKVFKADPRAYALLEEFHAAPNVRYMTKIRNNDQASRGGEGHHGGGHS